MLKRIGLTILAAAIISFWWLMIGNSKGPKTSTAEFDIDIWRALISEDAPSAFPSEIRWHEIGKDVAPNFVVTAGHFIGKSEMSYNAFQIVAPGGTIIVDSAVDEETALSMTITPDAWSFNARSYDDMLFAMLNAEKVLMTHEHLDHIIGIARHTSPDELARNLWLNAAQIEALPNFIKGEVPTAFKELEPKLHGKLKKIAPGVLVIPAPGHTAGSHMIFVTLDTGAEYLLVGDIAWNQINIEKQRTRPLLTQYIVFDPNEDRDAVKDQLTALHAIAKANPSLMMIPAHDRTLITDLVSTGALQKGLAE